MGAAWGVDSACLVGLAPMMPERRIVAVSLTAAELLRSGTDLVRQAEGAQRVDLLLVCESKPVWIPPPARLDPDRDLWTDSAWGDLWGGDVVEGDDTEELAGLVRRFRAAGIRSAELHVHRLALREPLDAAAEQDLVAALSELIGFDPEPGVYLLAPVPEPADPSRVVVNHAVQRVARVYGLPTLRYRRLELAVTADTP